MGFFHDEDEVTVCDNHDMDVQLIWTFAFPYKEFWCPACGVTYGMLGAGRNAKWNWRIHNQYIKDLKKSRSFLRANGILCCSRFKHKGKWISPREMPEELKNYYQKQAKNWKYRI